MNIFIFFWALGRHGQPSICYLQQHREGLASREGARPVIVPQAGQIGLASFARHEDKKVFLKINVWVRRRRASGTQFRGSRRTTPRPGRRPTANGARTPRLRQRWAPHPTHIAPKPGITTSGYLAHSSTVLEEFVGLKCLKVCSGSHLRAVSLSQYSTCSKLVES